MIKKIDGCKKNSEKSSTIKVGEYIPRGYSMSSDGTRNNHDVYRTKDCVKNFVKPWDRTSKEDNQLWKQ